MYIYYLLTIGNLYINHILYIYIYILYIYIYIFQIAATNIISSTAGLSFKYNNQIVRNSKLAIACYKNTISTLSNLKNLFFLV